MANCPKRYDIKDKAQKLDQLERLEDMYQEICVRRPRAIINVSNSAGTISSLIREDTREHFKEWLKGEIERLRKELGVGL